MSDEDREQICRDILAHLPLMQEADLRALLAAAEASVLNRSSSQAQMGVLLFPDLKRRARATRDA